MGLPTLGLLALQAIVAPSAWHGELGAYVEARRAELPVERGTDAPERLERWPWRGWRERGLGYVLLVGDADTLPVRFMALDRATAPACHYDFYPCDLYYADVAEADGALDDWNAGREGSHGGDWGEVRGERNKDGRIDHDRVSYDPAVALGRRAVSDIDELRAVVTKTLAWRGPGERPGALLAHADGWVDARPRVGGWVDAR
jgi:hypothetical protein